ncbi:uncharacterized protein B0H18DRAFT_886508, partial [Fomitopsis serialis]|uniref:uncharacterized protein n=1 Tax=Fomitopsis serialis TaxID=139415 RepID=UPI002008CE34
ASNHRDEFLQMVRYISRREKVTLYEVFQNECRADEQHEHVIALHDGKVDVDVVKAAPSTGRQGRKSRFDTVVVLENEQAESTGVLGTCIGRVKVIFKLPNKLSTVRGSSPAPSWWPKGPLAYVEWFT